MKSKTLNRIISLFIVLVTLCSFIPTNSLHVHADYEDGMECWFCDHYHWDEYCCGMCGYSPEEGELGNTTDTDNTTDTGNTADTGNNNDSTKAKANKNNDEGGKSYVIWIVIASTIVVLGAGGGVTYFVIKKKKKV